MEFIRIIKLTFTFIKENYRSLLKSTLIPLITLMLLMLCESINTNSYVEILIQIISMFVYTVLAITAHRFVLLGSGSFSKWGIGSWSKREIFFFLHIIALILVFIPLMLLNFIPMIGGVIALIIYVWASSRLSLVFPGISIDKGVSFKISWWFTKNHQKLMLSVIVIVPVIFAIPALIVSFIPHSDIINQIITVAATIFEVAALSMAYQHIIQTEYAQG